MNQIKLGKFISDIRNERKMTQDELAEKIGVSSGKVISKWECGNTMPDFETIIAISKALHITLYELSICQKIENKSLIDKTKNKFITHKDLFLANLKNKILIISSLILGIIFGFSTIFTINNYKTIKMYNFYYSPNETKFNVEGNIFVTKDYSIFNLNKINNIENDKSYLDTAIYNIQYEVLDKDNQRVVLINSNNTKNKNLENYNLLQTIQSAAFSKKIETTKIPKDPNLKLKITYFNEEHSQKEIIINFKMEKIFENTL